MEWLFVSRLSELSNNGLTITRKEAPYWIRAIVAAQLPDDCDCLKLRIDSVFHDE